MKAFRVVVHRPPPVPPGAKEAHPMLIYANDAEEATMIAWEFFDQRALIAPKDVKELASLRNSFDPRLLEK